MLCLTRKEGERIRVAGNIWLRIDQIRVNSVRVSFDAPDDVEILREELIEGETGRQEADE